MQPTHSLTVISLGGGVQSSVMALMASQGAFDAIPDCAIFADTHWEPPSLYTRLDWLAERLGFPVYVVDNGRSLREDVKTLTNHSFVDLPLYTEGTQRPWRWHRAASVHRALQDKADSAEDTRAAGTHKRTTCSVRHRRRAVAGHLDRRGDPGANVPRQVDT